MYNSHIRTAQRLTHTPPTRVSASQSAFFLPSYHNLEHVVHRGAQRGRITISITHPLLCDHLVRSWGLDKLRPFDSLLAFLPAPSTPPAAYTVSGLYACAGYEMQRFADWPAVRFAGEWMERMNRTASLMVVAPGTLGAEETATSSFPPPWKRGFRRIHMRMF
jgi:hypothetical protein